MMTLNKLIAAPTLVLAIAASLLFGTGLAAAQDADSIALPTELKIGFVNAAVILEKAPQAKAMLEQLEKDFLPREQEIVASKDRLAKLEQRLLDDGATMSDAEIARIKRDMVAARREITRATEDFNEDFNLRRNQELANLQKLVQQAIRELAVEKKFDLIVSDGVVFASKRINITGQVIERMSKQ